MMLCLDSVRSMEHQEASPLRISSGNDIADPTGPFCSLQPPAMSDQSFGSQSRLAFVCTTMSLNPSLPLLFGRPWPSQARSIKAFFTGPRNAVDIYQPQNQSSFIIHALPCDGSAELYYISGPNAGPRGNVGDRGRQLSPAGQFHSPCSE